MKVNSSHARKAAKSAGQELVVQQHSNLPRGRIGGWVEAGHKKSGVKPDEIKKEKQMVGETGFEPATSSSRTKRATRLRYTPKEGADYTRKERHCKP